MNLKRERDGLAIENSRQKTLAKCLLHVGNNAERKADRKNLNFNYQHNSETGCLSGNNKKLLTVSDKSEQK